MDHTDWLMAMTAIAVLIFLVAAFGVWPALAITGVWVGWLIGAGLVMAQEAYRDADD